MEKRLLIENATIVNEGRVFKGYVLIEGSYIVAVKEGEAPEMEVDERMDATGLHLLPGVIDDQVHFREPGLTHKGNIASESAAAAAGGITSFMEMPNTVPNTFTQELLEQKYELAAASAVTNYSFFMGASNDNLQEVLKTNPQNVCGVKVFMGSSTGNMLVDNPVTLEGLFKECKMLIATHCEDEETVKANMEKYKALYPNNDAPASVHPEIRNEEACYKSSSMAVALAKKHNTRLHILHISTARELSLFEPGPVKNKRITSEACVHHLWFSDADYATKGNYIKWNPAVKTAQDRDAILQAVKDNRIDVIATDHAPHTIEEKNQPYFQAPSGGPLVQHSLVAMLELVHQGKLSLETMVHKMSHAVADCFQIEKRGYLRAGYFADLVLVNLQNPWQVNRENILYHCGWSPFEGQTFQSKVHSTLINGNWAYRNGRVDQLHRGKRLTFVR